jgi:hypothetical protein
MSTYTFLKYHIVFGTQYRRPLLHVKFRKELYAYIARQDEHHRKKSFADEYRELLLRHEIQFDEKYLFDDEHSG